ncbi:MAG: ABC transporter permease [Mycobacterium sp.]|nr:ABC transporter permease [Mycobacterium sp.]
MTTVTSAPTPMPPTETDFEMGFESRSQLREAVRRFVRNPSAMAGLVVFTAIILFCYIYPPFYRWDWATIDQRTNAAGNYIYLSKPPGTGGHPLGTDGSGFDLLARMMRGTQRDFVIVVIVTAMTTIIGVLFGAIAGFSGSVVDNIVMRFVDIMLSIPALVILIVVAYRFRSLSGSAAGLAVILGLFGWTGLARLVRANFLQLKEREFVEAAHAMGAGTWRIILRHLIPNSLGTILVFATLTAAVSIIAETSLTFLGYGVQRPDTSLGQLVSDGVQAESTRWWLFYPPGLLILIIVLSVNLIGDGIRNSFDPKHNRVRD